MFWILSAVLVAVALAFVVVPLLRSARATAVSREAINVSVYRDQLRELDADLASGTLTAEAHAETLRELERRVLEDTEVDAARSRAGAGRGAAIAAVLGVPVLAVALYTFVGTPQALLPENAQGAAAHATEAAQVEAMVERLAEQMKANPGDPEGWLLLARSYGAMERYAESVEAYKAALERLPKDDAQVLADYADTLAMAQGRTLEGEPAKLIERALAADPDNVKALALAGTVAFERGEYESAAARWERIVRTIPADTPLAQSVRASIEKARSLAAASAAGGTAQPPAAAAAAPAAGAPGPAVSGRVELAPGLASRVAPEDTLFVFARAAEGPRMPVAILRAQAKDLPLEFTLDDRSSMMGAKLSAQKRVVVGARISKSGSATPQAGDIEGYSEPVAPGASDLKIVVSDSVK